MDIGILALLGKTVSLMENLGFMWLVHTGFELNLWERLIEGKTKEQIAEHSNWDTLLLDHLVGTGKAPRTFSFQKWELSTE